MTYNSGIPHFRNLSIEAMIEKSLFKDNAIELLKQEIEMQKRKKGRQR